jgi:hypothetical protein
MKPDLLMPGARARPACNTSHSRPCQLHRTKPSKGKQRIAHRTPSSWCPVSQPLQVMFPSGRRAGCRRPQPRPNHCPLIAPRPRQARDHRRPTAQRGMNWHSQRPTGDTAWVGLGGGGGFSASEKRTCIASPGYGATRRLAGIIIISHARWMLGIRMGCQSGDTRGALPGPGACPRRCSRRLQTRMIAYQALIMDSKRRLTWTKPAYGCRQACNYSASLLA